MLTTTAYTGGMWLSAVFVGVTYRAAAGAIGRCVPAICTMVNLVDQSIFKGSITRCLAEVIGSICVALVLFFLFRIHPVSELFSIWYRLGSHRIAAFLAAVAIAGWAFIGFDACSLLPKKLITRENDPACDFPLLMRRGNRGSLQFFFADAVRRA